MSDSTKHHTVRYRTQKRMIFYLSENDRVPIPVMLFLLVPAGTLKNWSSDRN